MIILSAKLIGKTCEITTKDEVYSGVVKAVYDDWAEIEEDGETRFVNKRYICCITVENTEPVTRPKKQKHGLFSSNKEEEM